MLLSPRSSSSSFGFRRDLASSSSFGGGGGAAAFGSALAALDLLPDDTIDDGFCLDQVADHVKQPAAAEEERT